MATRVRSGIGLRGKLLATTGGLVLVVVAVQSTIMISRTRGSLGEVLENVTQRTGEREKAQRSALKTLANQAFEGAFGPLMHFLVQEQKLTVQQRQELIKMLEEPTQDSGG